MGQHDLVEASRRAARPAEVDVREVAQRLTLGVRQNIQQGRRRAASRQLRCRLPGGSAR